MTASKTKYYFRKKPKNVAEKHESAPMQVSSSTDSDEFQSSIDNARRVTLHVITDPGQSTGVKSSFQYLVGRLDSALDVICVSERFKPLRIKEAKLDKTVARVPAIAVVLFFRDDFKIDDSTSTHDSNNNTKNRHDVTNGDVVERAEKPYKVREVFSQKPWRFHHRVAVTGKLISCDTNVQDYFEYNHNDACVTSRNGGRKTPLLVQDRATQNLFTPHFPLWGVRKVHYGKQIIRFTLFVSQENWDDQINLYKLILRGEGTKIRDDFCYFETYSNASTAVQLALKKLPVNLKPQPLTSSILQFKVKNVGQLVPLLPNSCDPISELRWRTRDHDNNLILLQIHRTHGVAVGSSFVERVFTDPESSDSREKTPVPIKGISPTSNLQPRINGRLTPDIQKPKTRGRDSNRLQTNATDSNQDTSVLGGSFICPSLPEKMPLLKPTLYLTRKPRCTSSSSSTASSGRHSARTSSPERHNVATLRSVSNPRFIAGEKHPKIIKSGRLSASQDKINCENGNFFKSDSDDGFYV